MTIIQKAEWETQEKHRKQNSLRALHCLHCLYSVSILVVEYGSRGVLLKWQHFRCPSQTSFDYG
jgi:hypothetical protein